MKLTKRNFGKLLESKLKTTTDVVVLSRWAYQIYLDNARNLEDGLKGVIFDLVRMEDSPEFEYSAKELLDTAKRLVDEN